MGRAMDGGDGGHAGFGRQADATGAVGRVRLSVLVLTVLALAIAASMPLLRWGVGASAARVPSRSAAAAQDASGA